MITATDDATTTSNRAVLPQLRALATKPIQSITDALQVAGAQAQLLRNLLSDPAHQIIAQITRLIPDVTIETMEDIPRSGIAFCADGHWYIHIRSSDAADVQAFTALHELKHIIDYPLRRNQSNVLSGADREVLANHFANQVLAQKSTPITT